MQTEQTENELIIRESPGCLWIFGLLFVIVGGFFIYGSVIGFTHYGREITWMLVLTFVLGSSALSTGVWIIYGAPITKVIINRVENTVSIMCLGLLGRRETLYYFDEIEQFCLVAEKDSKGDDVWFLGMNLTNEETVKISLFASHDELFKYNFVFQANEFTRKQTPLHNSISELEVKPTEK